MRSHYHPKLDQDDNFVISVELIKKLPPNSEKDVRQIETE